MNSERASRSIKMSLSAGMLATILSGAAAAQPTDLLRVGVWDFPPGRGNPYSTVSAGVPQVWIWPAMFDALTNIDNKGTAMPGLEFCLEVIVMIFI